METWTKPYPDQLRPTEQWGICQPEPRAVEWDRVRTNHIFGYDKNSYPATGTRQCTGCSRQAARERNLDLRELHKNGTSRWHYMRTQ